MFSLLNRIFSKYINYFRYLPLMIEENEESKPFLNQIKSTSEDLESTSLLEEEEFINFLHHERIHESDLDSLKSTRV